MLYLPVYGWHNPENDWLHTFNRFCYELRLTSYKLQYEQLKAVSYELLQ
jgi:hypothetical protein